MNKQKALLVACGSFSPITYAHLRMMELSKEVLVRNGFVVHGGILSPVSDAYKKKGLVTAEHRVNMCKVSVIDSDWIKCNDWESNSKTFVPTVEVLQHYQTAYPDSRIFFVSGSDLVNSFMNTNLWTRNEVDIITKNFTTIVVDRKEFPISDAVNTSDILARLIIVEQDVPNEVSSTKLRKLVSEKRSIKYLTADGVVTYIRDNGLYK